jgi:hypothetical protein
LYEQTINYSILCLKVFRPHYILLSMLLYLVQDDGLLHTTCGTPNYVAPEVIMHIKPYNGNPRLILLRLFFVRTMIVQIF